MSGASPCLNKVLASLVNDGEEGGRGGEGRLELRDDLRDFVVSGVHDAFGLRRPSKSASCLDACKASLSLANKAAAEEDNGIMISFIMFLG